jgi:3-methyladenine DNA glycosylase Tag
VQDFSKVEARAIKRKGGAEALEALLPKVKTPRALAKITDDRWLARMTQGVFSAGFVWKVIEAKWDGFEAAFGGFVPAKVATLGDDDLDQLAGDERIVRNRQKIWATRDNARLVLDLGAEYGSFGKMVAGWPGTDLIGLYDLLARRGSRLGGMTGPYLMRAMGKDTFMLTDSVLRALQQAKVLDAPKATSKKARQQVQAAFNTWAVQTGRSYGALSRILACSVP